MNFQKTKKTIKKRHIAFDSTSFYVQDIVKVTLIIFFLYSIETLT